MFSNTASCLKEVTKHFSRGHTELDVTGLPTFIIPNDIEVHTPMEVPVCIFCVPGEYI
jgi:hypothetical protein